MKLKLIVACAALATGFSANAMTKAEYNAGRDKVKVEYDAEYGKCKPLSGNARDICREEARGKRDVAQAELKAMYEPTANNQYAARKARASATYEVSKERCDDVSGNAKDVCLKDAKAVHVKAMADAKVAEASKETGSTSVKTTETKAEGNKDVREAAYKATVERCDALSGDVKDKCVADAKVKFGM